MFGTMGISELVIILVIVLIIFGAGRLPQIGEGVGKALKGFKKEVNEAPPPPAALDQQQLPPSEPEQARPIAEEAGQSSGTGGVSPSIRPNIPHAPGPELTPGTTASLLYNTRPQAYQEPHNPSPRGSSSTGPESAQRVVSLEERAAAPVLSARSQYPSLPSSGQARPSARRPSAIVNKEAVARVQAQQAAFKAGATRAQAGLSPDDMQTAGEGVGDVLRTFRKAMADVRHSVDPEMRTIQAEIEAAQKEVRQSLQETKDLPPGQDEPPKRA